MKDLTPEQKESFKKEIIRVSDGSYSIIQDGNNDLKQDINHIKNIYGIEPKMSRKLIKTHYDASLEEQKAEFQEFEEICEEIFN